MRASQSIIRSQEQAFARDDAAAAYSFAAPGPQHYFQSPDGFMAMVRNGYAPVYRHRSFDFDALGIAGRPGEPPRAPEVVHH